MITLVKWAMRIGGTIIICSVSLALRELMPLHSIASSWIIFIGLAVSFAFALVLLGMSLVLSYPPGVVKAAVLGERKQPVSTAGRTKCAVNVCPSPRTMGSLYCADCDRKIAAKDREAI